MPIREENRDRYPADWPAIATALKQAAGWRCDCDGRCGRGHRGRCPEVHGQEARIGTPGTRVVLGVAHLNDQPEDCSPENLLVMCSGCHLHYDIPHHRQTRRERAERELLEAGQLRLEHVTTCVNAVDTTRDPWGVSSDLTRSVAA